MDIKVLRDDLILFSSAFLKPFKIPTTKKSELHGKTPTFNPARYGMIIGFNDVFFHKQRGN